MSTMQRKLAEELYLPRNLKTGVEENSTIAEYKNILNNGLNGCAAEKKKVVIVGAGISGLFSAILLADFGHEVTILEANESRVGGRVKTFGFDSSGSPFTPGQYAEAGAMRFPSKHPLLMAYIDKYKLEKQQFFNVDVDDPDKESPEKVSNTLIRCNSYQERRSAYAKNPVPTNQGFYQDSQAPTPTNQGFYQDSQAPTIKAGELLDEALDQARDYYSYAEDGKRYDKADYDEWIDGWAKLIEDFDKHTLGSYLREVAGLDEDAIGLIGTLENLSARMPLSFIHSFLGRSDINPDNVYYELKGGSWQLTEVLHNAVNNHPNIKLKMGHRMTHIDYYDERAQNKHAENAPGKTVSIRTIDESREENPHISGDIAIITIPFSSLRFVRITPDLSYGKRRAIIELHYDAATKVLIEFSQRWWEFDQQQWEAQLLILKEQGKISEDEYKQYLDELHKPYTEGGKPALHAFGGGSITDNPNRAMYYPSHQVKSHSVDVPGGVILASYTWSDDARRWDSMADEDRYEFALRGLAIMHGERIRPFVAGKDGKHWIKDEHGNITRGAATQSWARSPYAFGEAAVFQAYQLTNLHPHIPHAEGPIFFAGEHTSLKHAWLEGALESAIRVAVEVKDNTGSEGE